ncbi:MAG: IS21 family transposase [Proteobacteria bacterium]|nr:IS21 family transposase [Pseudomonadota bacterium]
MIPPEVEAKIIRLYTVERWPVGTIARQLCVHHTTVRRALVRAGLPEPARAKRPRLVDPYVPFIKETLDKHPTLPASRLYEMVRQRGYPGAPDHFRHIVAMHRPRKPAEAYLRLRTLPGEQAQVDWAHFGTLRVGTATRPLMAFVVVLSWSRRIFLRFCLAAKMEDFLRGHVAAFEAFGGVPRVLLYDNLKSAVVERRGDAIRFNPTLLSFAGHYHYEPRPVAPYRGNEKGRVERAIRYIRTSFWPARRFEGLVDLNEQAATWCSGQSSDRRCPEDRTLSVRQAFESEQAHLLSRPDDAFCVEDRVEVAAGKTPYVRFDLNDYSVPADRVRRLLVVRATETQVRILDGTEQVAAHARSYSRGEQIEDPAHIAALVASKRAASQGRGKDRLSHAVPGTTPLLVALAERGGNIGSAVSALLRLLDTYGTEELAIAVQEALQGGSPSPHTVRLVLERRRQQRGAPPSLPIELPDDDRVRGAAVRPHALHKYDPVEVNDDDRA